MMLSIPRPRGQAPTSIYERLGLRDLPFPTTAVVDPYSGDPRINGTIFAESPVKDEIDKFERLLIRRQDFPNRAKLGYLWSRGDRESGRGMGKTALLRFFRQRINKDWGYTEFNGDFSACVIYVSFPSQIDRRYMEQLSLSALVDICKSDLLDAARAYLRLQSISEEKANEIMQIDGGEPQPHRILDDEVLATNDVAVAALNSEIAGRLATAGVEHPIAAALCEGRFEDYLRIFRKDRRLEPFYVPYDTRILEYSRSLLFNTVVQFLRASGFAGGYLFIDDIENLVDQMTRRHRIEFAKEFALCTVRPGYANTASGFFSCVITTHQQASTALSQAWGEAGLSPIARLDPSSPNSIELPLPSKDDAVEMIKAHLDHYRIDPSDKGSIKPFNQNGIEALLRNQLHPRTMLQNAARVMIFAADQGVQAIGEALVSEAIRNAPATAGSDFTEGIEGAV